MAGSAGGVRAGGAYVEIFAKDGAFQQAMTRVQNRIRAVGTAMRQAGTSLTMGAAAIAAPMVLAVRNFAAFDDAIRATGAVSGATAPQLESLRRTAQELGATTSFTAVQVASLMTELGRAGFKPDEIDAMTGAVLNLARATGTEAAMSAGIMAATLRQFGLGAGDATRVADVLTGAANMSFNTVESLGEALQYAGVTAAQAGMSIEDTAAILGTLGNVGIQGSNAGTALRRLLTITGAEAGKLEEIFGVSFLDAAGNVRPLVDTLGEVAAATNGLPSGERLAKFNEAFGLLGITGASAIAGTAADTRQLAEALRQASRDGLAAKTAIEMDAGVGGSFRLLLSAVEGVGNAFTEALAPSIQIISAGLQSLANVMRAVLKDFPILAQVMAGVTAGALVLGVALIAGGFALQVMAKGLGVLMAGLRLLPALMTPVGIAVAGIAAAVVGGIVIARQLSPAFRGETNAIMAALARLDFASAWQIMNLNFAIALTQMAAGADAATRQVMGFFAATGAWIGDKLIEGLDRFMGLFGADIITIQSQLERLGVFMRAAFDWNFAANGMQEALDEIDRRATEARANAPTADARAAQRTEERQRAADERQQSADEAAEGWARTVDELRADLDRAKQKPQEEAKADDPAAAASGGATPAGRGVTSAKEDEPAGADGIGQTQGTFGSGAGLGIGPELAKMADPAKETAKNTARTATAVEGFLSALTERNKDRTHSGGTIDMTAGEEVAPVTISSPDEVPFFAPQAEFAAAGGVTDESMTADQATAELAAFTRGQYRRPGDGESAPPAPGVAAASPAAAAAASMVGQVAPQPPAATAQVQAVAAAAQAGTQVAASTSSVQQQMMKKLDAVTAAIQAHAKLTQAGNSLLEQIAANTATQGAAFA